MDQVRQAALAASPVAQVVVSTDGRLALANDAATRLFGLSARDLGRPFQDLDLSYRPVDLRTSIDEAADERRDVWLREIEWSRSPGERAWFDVQVIPLGSVDRGVGVSIHFHDVTRHRRLHDELEETHRHLETAYEELQSTNEELETTNEELQSTVEELETTNEELQSTNEELETMNEELQSMNDELQSMNEELRDRTTALNDVNGYFDSVLTSLQAGVIVVDPELRVRTWNRQAEDLWGLRSDEVLGQHLLNLDIGLPVELVRPMVREALADPDVPAGRPRCTQPARSRRHRPAGLHRHVQGKRRPQWRRPGHERNRVVRHLHNLGNWPIITPEETSANRRGSPRGEVTVPLTIGELSQATGVPIATLRDWDRRHGLSPSRRTLGNHRRYSRADAELVIAVRDLVAEGMRLRESVQRVRSAQPQRRSPSHGCPSRNRR